MKKILVVNVNWLGDVIFSSPVFKALKEAYPDSQISCLAPSRVKEVLESIPWVDEIIVYDEKGAHFNPLAKLKLIFDLKAKKFDFAFLLHRSWTRACLVYLAGIPQRVGYDTKDRGIFLTHAVSEKSGLIHRSDYYLNVIESYGVNVKDRKVVLKVSEQAQKEINQILEKHGIQDRDEVIVVNPGGNWDLKRWPKENFALLIQHLISEKKVRVVISGAEKDGPLVQDIVSKLLEKPIILTGHINLKQLTALMNRAKVVVSADSGPLHLANSVGTAVVGIFGPTRPELTGPRGKGESVILQNDVGCNREACYFLACPDNICMQSVTVENVLEAIKQINHS